MLILFFYLKRYKAALSCAFVGWRQILNSKNKISIIILISLILKKTKAAGGSTRYYIIIYLHTELRNKQFRILPTRNRINNNGN
ncbi:hypothetical protein CLV51_101553 [Chitinophaga niastensis]|uniref:Uncharacterized protein n=1 Tax=Chitinophaga niastensis TaxID=536980 RepID=A0A2P8HSN5_CHINA|nr:hypothetical protein CLV51_101553 [Chitinophaga niastensis]